MTLLSFIVPVYNVSSYLSKCLDSILNQSLSVEEYEIVVVNDGSTDGSFEIVQCYAKKYPNITVITQKNGGLSSARNVGIRVARGEYIQFVDSDDYLEPNVIKGLLEKMERENLDVLRFNYQNVNEKYEPFNPNREYRQFVDYRDELTDGFSFLAKRLGYSCYAWQFILKASLLQDESCDFKLGIYFEDTEWTPRMLVRARRVTSVDCLVYNYLMRPGSITQGLTNEKQRKVLNDKMGLIAALLEQKKNISDTRWFDGMIGQTVISILGMLGLLFFKEKRIYIARLKEMSVFPISNYHCTSRNKKRVSLINLSPLAYCWFIRIKNIK